jgi:HlyD family secretion protein
MDIATDGQVPRSDHRPYARLGYAAIALVFGVFGVWASLAPLGRAAVASGQVAVESDHKVVQHLEGGIVREILVKEDQRVSAGDVLFRLQPTQALANADALGKQVDAALALESRLLAERDRADQITFPPALLVRQSVPETANAVAGEQRQFAERRRALESQIKILSTQIAEKKQEIAGRDQQRASLESQLASYTSEVNTVGPAATKGFFPRNKLLELERERSRIEGDLALAKSEVARLTESIEEAMLAIRQTEQKFDEDVSQQLADVRSRLADLRDKLVVAEDVLGRVEVRAQRSGIVIGLKVHTVGAVARPGDTLAEIVPIEDGLKVSARISPTDIDTVAVGQRAEVRFPNFSSRTTPVILGQVGSVSADAILDDATHQTYYLAQVVIDYETLSPELAGRLTPGMPADVLISTGQRTLLQYLLEPLTNSLRKTFREK